MAIPTTQRLLRTLFRRASTIFTGPRSSQRWRAYTSAAQQSKPSSTSSSSSSSQHHQHQHTHHQQHHYQHTNRQLPNHEPSWWSNISFRAVVAISTTTRPIKPQVVTTIRCYSKRLEESPHSSSPSPTASPHSRRRWSPLLGLIPMTFVSSQNDEDDKMLQGSGPTSTSGSPSMTSMTSSPSQRLRGRTGSSPLDFVRMRLRDMTPDDEDISPQTSPILPIRGYDKTHTWQRHGKVGTLQFELEDEDEMTPPSHNLTPTTPPTPSTSYFASRVDSDGRLVVRPTDVSTLQAWHQLSSFLSSSSHVTSLRLQGMVLSAAHVTLLGNDVLRHIHNLTFVDNNLGITDILPQLITILKLYPQLESLSLMRQSLTDDHIIMLLPIMTTHAMTHVSLAWNGIGDEGAKRLSLVLRQAQSILKMDLSYNVIGPRGSDALSLIQQQIHRLGRTLSINLKQNYRHSETPPIKRDEKLGWGMHTTSIHASTSSMGMGSVTASEMLGVMASDITTSVIPRSQPIAIPTPSQSTSTFERHFLSGMSFH